MSSLCGKIRVEAVLYTLVRGILCTLDKCTFSTFMQTNMYVLYVCIEYLHFVCKIACMQISYVSMGE